MKPTLEFNGQCPAWLFPILKWLGLVIGNPWNPVKSSYIADIIEETAGRSSSFTLRSFDRARKLIYLMEKELGPSTETVMLDTRISRYELLGK